MNLSYDKRDGHLIILHGKAKFHHFLIVKFDTRRSEPNTCRIGWLVFVQCIIKILSQNKFK